MENPKELRCPKCGDKDNQKKHGVNRSSTQRCFCKLCNASYTLDPKSRAIPEHIREIAIREYFMGVSGRGVGKIHRMGKENAMRWIQAKKKLASVDK